MKSMILTATQTNVARCHDCHSEATASADGVAVYDQWLTREIQASLDDSRPNISHDDVMGALLKRE